MKKFCLAKKIGMSQFMDEEGEVTPVTILKLEPLKVVELKTKDSHGYDAVVVGYNSVKETALSKPKAGQFKKRKMDFFKSLKEFRVNSLEGYEVNSDVDLSSFIEGQVVDVRSKSKGMGFAGTIKRHNFSRGLMTHGSKSHRIPGSIGAGSDPSRVFKGTKMGGHYGDAFNTIKNLMVIKIDDGVIFIKGAVPGKKNNIVEIFSR